MKFTCGWWLLLLRPLLALLYMCLIALSGISSSNNSVFAFRWTTAVISRRLRVRSIPAHHSSHYDGNKHFGTNTRVVLPNVPQKLIRLHSDRMSTKASDTNEVVREATTREDPMEGLPRPLLLGSASFTRKLILTQMGIDYHILVRPIDEREIGSRDTDRPEALVLAVAQAKMTHLLQEITAGRCDNDLPPQNSDDGDSNIGEWIVFTADQVVTCQGRILEKPDNITQAKEFVTQYGKHPCSTVGCVVLTHLPSRTCISGIHTATVHFLPSLTEEVASNMIDTLIASKEPVLSCAGGLMIEHPLTQQYVDRIEGSMDSVMGLCPETVQRLLRGLKEAIR